METAKTVAWWVFVAVCLSPIWGAFVWHTYDFYIRPGLLSRAEIERLADEILRRRPDNPDEAAFIEEQASWHRSDTFEQGKWRRVRRMLWRRRDYANGVRK